MSGAIIMGGTILVLVLCLASYGIGYADGIGEGWVRHQNDVRRRGGQ